LKTKLGPKHPDVVKLGKEVKALSDEVAQLKTAEVRKSLTEEKPDNPAYINLKTQIASTELEIRRLGQEERRIKSRIAKSQSKIDAAPSVEREYNRLLRDHESARIKYNELMNKLMEAKVAQGMEESQRGERFTIIDPAQLPEKPYKPNRIAIFLIAFVLALGAGVGMAALREAVDPSVKSEEHLADITKVPVFSVINLMESAEERRARRLKRVLWVLIVLAIIALGLYLFDQYVMPLEILWIKIQRKLIKIGISGFIG
jgi:succinoglycan biosynthesis transport protein ExoP